MKFLSDYKQFPVGLPIAGSCVDPDSKGYVYVIGFNEPGIVKIGSATSIGCRLTSLQSGNPFELIVRAAVSVYDIEPISVEMKAHKLAAKVGRKIRGEWFDIDEDDALRCIIEAAKSKRTRYGPVKAAVEAQNQLVADAKSEHEEQRRAELRRKLGVFD